MAKSDTEIEPPPVTAAWGTWEELLLASAVNRYGTTSWDSISSELRKRTSCAPIYLTPHHCEQKYTQLKRRFNQPESDLHAVTIPWLEDLRKQRVLELQRQLQNYDLYISSLQLKVNKLTEETEKKSDLGNGDEEIELQKSKKEPETAVVSGDVSGHVSGHGNDSEENQSVNGSNGNLGQEHGVEKSENENGKGSPVRTGEEKVEIVTPVREEDSCDGRPGESVKSEPEGESLKSEGKNSDVQSSASKSKKERIDRVRRGSTKDREDQSMDSIPVRSLPLVGFLNRLHELGSALFERRLDRQEKLRYKNLIRQHIDYEILQTRLKEGWYSDGNDRFFRDLLLLVNNTCIFYPKESSESKAADDLRQLILQEMMSKKKHKNELKSNEKQSSSKPTNLPPKRGSEPSDSLLLKPKLAGPIVVCRKRSKITAKAAGSSSGADKRKEQTELKNSEKLIEETHDTTKRSRDGGFPLMTKKKGKSVEKNQDTGKTPESSDKKKKLTEAEEKKQSAAKFLNRMKRTSSIEPLQNTLKSSSERSGVSENDSKDRGEQKKSGGSGSGSKSGGGGGGDGKKHQTSKKSSGGRQVKEQGSPARRSVGRPPKRAAAPPPPILGKRNRDSTDSETLGSKQSEKRSKTGR